jgi:hypothetical protein
MKPVFQTNFAENGNCFNACVASILELDLDDIPDFGAAIEGVDWMTNLNNWLRPKDLCYFEGRLSYDENYDNFFSDKDFYFIATGPTNRSRDILHSTVYRKGMLVHDPLPRGEGILKEKIGLRFGVFVKCFNKNHD